MANGQPLGRARDSERLGDSDQGTNYELSLRAVFRFLLAVCVMLVLLNLASRLTGADISRLDVDVENSVPTVWSTLQLALLTAICALRTKVAAVAGERWAPWALTTASAGFIALDEALQIHEILINPMRSMFNTSGFFHLAWIIPYSALAIVIGLSLLPWVMRLPPATCNGLVLAAALFVLGAVVMEGIGATIIEREEIESTAYTFTTSTEELLEMVAVVVAIRTVLYDLMGGTSFALRLSD